MTCRLFLLFTHTIDLAQCAVIVVFIAVDMLASVKCLLGSIQRMLLQPISSHECKVSYLGLKQRYEIGRLNTFGSDFLCSLLENQCSLNFLSPEVTEPVSGCQEMKRHISQGAVECL